jgi:hypothetical protein
MTDREDDGEHDVVCPDVYHSKFLFLQFTLGDCSHLIFS